MHKNEETLRILELWKEGKKELEVQKVQNTHIFG